MKANVEMLIVFLWLLLFVICSSVSLRVFFKHKFFLRNKTLSSLQAYELVHANEYK